jgi:hypothetical protein
MTDFAHGRRRLLRSVVGWIGAAAAFATTRSAEAWRVEEIDPASSLGSAYAKRCGDPPDHAALVAQLQSQLSKDPSASSLTSTCPICGCPVIVARAEPKAN